MSDATGASGRRDAKLERVLAHQLRYGTWAACGVTAAGLALEWGGAGRAPVVSAGEAVIRAGVAIFILLPVSRLAVMLGFFLWRRDYVFGVVTAVVLVIIAAGVICGVEL
ncbi:MAG: hypothetical protein JWO82_1828 [Akkermansiaceae bacterium]|nr:hypothetical protein [Akkermansiaceae bacterium]